MESMSELIMLLVGIFGSIVLDRLLRLIVSKLYRRICKKHDGSEIQITQDTRSVKAARRFTAIIPKSMWQALTWTIFIIGYASKCTSIWRSTAMYLVSFLAGKYMSPAQKLMLDIGYSTFTIYQTLQICKRDYQAFLALGGGGTPQTWNGFKRITLLEWFGKINTLEPPKIIHGKGYLSDLEQRSGQRPTVVGIAPQRQLDQRAPKDAFDYLLTYLDHLSAENTSRIHTATSFLEKHTNALLANRNFVRQPIFRTFGCEIMHPHNVDGSLHCVLHPNDIEKVINAGWGERHSIARADPWWMFWFFATESRPPIPEHLCFIYAPRSEYEVCVVAEIVEAGVKYVTGAGKGKIDECASPLKGLEDME